MKNYVGLNGTSSPRDKIFACPADNFYYEFTAADPTYIPQSLYNQSAYDYSSYWFNRGTPTVFGTNSPGIAGPQHQFDKTFRKNCHGRRNACLFNHGRGTILDAHCLWEINGRFSKTHEMASVS